MEAPAGGGVPSVVGGMDTHDCVSVNGDQQAFILEGALELSSVHAGEAL